MPKRPFTERSSPGVARPGLPTDYWEYAKLDEDLDGAPGSKAKATIYRLEQSSQTSYAWVAQTAQVYVYASYMQGEGTTLPEGTRVKIQRHADGRVYVNNADCGS